MNRKRYKKYGQFTEEVNKKTVNIIKKYLPSLLTREMIIKTIECHFNHHIGKILKAESNLYHLVIKIPHTLSLKITTRLNKKPKYLGFPGGAVVENLPANAGDTGSSPGLGRSHMPRSN